MSVFDQPPPETIAADLHRTVVAVMVQAFAAGGITEAQIVAALPSPDVILARLLNDYERELAGRVFRRRGPFGLLR